VFDTNIVIVGNVLTAPEWRRTTNTNSLVANFKVASTARKLDKDTGRWVDGNSLRVRVNCWRKLAEGVTASVVVGDPVVVAGRLYTRDWTDADGNQRTTYELEAVAVGHDLSRGQAQFMRNRPALSTTAAADLDSDGYVRGEPTVAAGRDGAPAGPSGSLFDDDDPQLGELRVPGYHPIAELNGAPVDLPDSAEDDDDVDDTGPGENGGDGPIEAAPLSRVSRTRRRTPVPA
jgi:single-strand DNA-binding protein